MLSPKERAVLAAVCDALVPSMPADHDPEGLFVTGAAAVGVADRVAGLIAALPDERDRARLRMLLGLLGSRFANLLLSGQFQSFTAMDQETRERILRGWATSAIQLRRVGFQALKRLTHVAYLCWPTANGSHPAWRAAGYPGPLPHPPPADEPEPLPTHTVDRDTTLDCDVVVVGSGAGGGVVAGVLAQSGRSVVVLEMGDQVRPRDMTQVEGEMLGALYLDRALLMTQSGSMPILAGSCLGGGTLINYTTSFSPPDALRQEWDDCSGLKLFSSPRFAESVDRVTARLDVGTRWTTPAERDRILERGCKALGWHVGVIPRNVTACREGAECGYCGYGCRHGAKNSTTRTYLLDATRAGARVVVNATAERVSMVDGRVTGVVASVRRSGGPAARLTVRARNVVVACGGIHTPALLLRSGVAHPAIGRGLRLHPVSAVTGYFPERTDPWTGSLQTRYSEQFADLEDRYGARFETTAIHFALPASGFGWNGARAFREELPRLAHLGLVGVLLRDRDAGSVRVSRSGRPRVHYELSRYDAEHMRRALRGAAQVLAAAGATEVASLHTPPVRVRTDRRGWLEPFGRGMDALGYRHARMSYISFHQMASASMGADPRTSVVGESGESHVVRGLYVADASAFPRSSGVNPMITIMAIADHVARAIQETW